MRYVSGLRPAKPGYLDTHLGESFSHGVKEALLHGYVDGELAQTERVTVEQFLAGSSRGRRLVNDFQRHNRILHDLYDSCLARPMPDALEALEFALLHKLERNIRLHRFGRWAIAGLVFLAVVITVTH